jgi:hypothetical protein
VENGGHGASAAAPIARKILDAYFDGKKKIISPQTLAQSQPDANVHR